jgi:hypothetical protein
MWTSLQASEVSLVLEGVSGNITNQKIQSLLNANYFLVCAFAYFFNQNTVVRSRISMWMRVLFIDVHWPRFLVFIWFRQVARRRNEMGNEALYTSSRCGNGASVLCMLLFAPSKGCRCSARSSVAGLCALVMPSLQAILSNSCAEVAFCP